MRQALVLPVSGKARLEKGVIPRSAGSETEDEAADPVGDGQSDAELAERLSRERQAGSEARNLDGSP